MSIETFMKLGQQCGLQGEDLLKFVDSREQMRKDELRQQQDAERQERVKERDEREKEREEREREREHEREMAQLGHKRNVANGIPGNVPNMPVFRSDSDELDAYILRFERHATLQKWPPEYWASVLGNLLTGRALDVYTRMSAEDASDYAILKATLLQHFALTSEGFRKRFRNAKRGNTETFLQYSARLTSYAKRWVELSGRDTTYETLLELVVMEQILEGCDRSTAIFIKERSPKNLSELVEIAEQYCSAHGPVARGPNRNAQQSGKPQKSASAKPQQGNSFVPMSERKCFICDKKGHMAINCPDRGKRGYSDKKPAPSRFESSKQTGSACIVGVCPGETDDSGIHEINVSVGDDMKSVTLQCGHRLPLVSAGCTVGTCMPVCKGLLNGKSVEVLRDTGCSTVVVRAKLVDKGNYTGEYQTCVLIDGTVRSVPVATIEVSCPVFSGKVNALCMTNPVYDVIIGNISGARKPDGTQDGWSAEAAKDDGVDFEEPHGLPDDYMEVGAESSIDEQETSQPEPDGTTQAAAVETRGMRRRKERPWKPLQSTGGLEITATREDIIAAQQQDESLEKLRKIADAGGVPKTVGKGSQVRYYFKNDLLFREFQSPTQANGQMFTQLVVPTPFRQQVLRLAHDSALAGHLKAKKTTERIWSHFYWPGLQSDVRRYCASCDPCQRTTPKGKVGKVPVVMPPLIDTCFRRIAVDLVGPLQPVTERGNRYILTIVDLATRYPEAVALPSIEAERVAEALMEVFSRLGVPNEILSDNGTQFVSGVMKEVSRLLGVKQFHTSPYHPMANGVCERFNGTLKQMLRRMCQERPRDWDRYLPALLFAYREVPHESLGYSPFELMYGRTVRGPITILKELWSEDISEDEVKTTYQYVLDLQDRLESTCSVAKTELEKSSRKYKKHFDVKAKERRFECGDQVLLLLPTSSNKLLMQWRGPYEVIGKVARNNYSLQIGNKKKTFHANLMKRYLARTADERHDDVTQNDDDNDFESEVTLQEPGDNDVIGDIGDGISEQSVSTCSAIQVIDDSDAENCDSVVGISFPSLEQTEGVNDVKFGEGIDEDRREEMYALTHEFEDVLTDVPGRTDIINHTVELNTQTHIRSRAYQVPQSLRETIRDEVDTMLKMGIIEQSNSPYASPVVIVKKKDGKNRFCVDYRKINASTVLDNEPIPNMEEIIADVGGATVFTKIDLSKGYWQIPVKEEDRAKTAFVTPDGQYQFKVLPFGMVNAPALFTRMMRRLLDGVPNVVHYIDDILIYSTSWEEHINDVRRVLTALRGANLTARPTKCQFGCTNVEFLGHRVGEGTIQPTKEGVEKVLAASRPTTKKEVRAFIGLVAYYRKFIPNMAVIATPLTDLTKNNAPTKVKWGDAEEAAFRTLKERVSKFPILRLPDSTKEFILRTDASDVGVGAVLMQDHEGKLFPVQFASRKLHPRERAYPIIERECLAVVWAVKKFAYYLHGRKFRLQTDHFPLANLSKTQMKNPRVMRWALAMQAHQYHVEVIKGSDNIGADYLSRCPSAE